jgi:hypothetical protein
MHYVPSLEIRVDARARRTFHYFRYRTQEAMSRYFPSDFWDSTVLQISQHHPTVRHAIIALGALYEDYEVTSRSPKSLNCGGEDSRRTFAIKEYTRAVQLLSKDLASDNPPLDCVLASCLIFICLEFLRNDVKTALNHLVAGLRIVDEVAQSSSPTTPPSPKYASKALDTSTTAIFKRLHSQAVFHGYPASVFASTSMPCIAFPSVTPTILTDLAHARLVLEDIIGSFFQLVRQYRNSGLLVPSTEDSDASSASRNYIVQNFLARLDSWQTAFNDIIKELTVDKPLEKAQLTAVSLLRVHHRHLYTILATVPLVNEMQYDEFRDSFAEMVSLTSDVIEGMDSESAELPTLSFDLGVLGPLHFVIVKCRDVCIRSKAMELMRRAPAREGIWRRDSVVQFSEWKIATEEIEAIKLGWQFGEVMPIEARIFWTTLTEEERSDGTKVTMARYRRSNGDEVLQFQEEVEFGVEMGEMI